MIRNLLRLIVLGLVVHAGVKIAPVFWNHVKFKDAVVETATYPGRRTPEELRALVLALADELSVPITEADVLVSRQGESTHISTAYTAQLEYIPRQYYTWRFVIDAEGRPPRFAGFTP